MPLISLFLPVRITKEKFSNFERYFQSILDCAENLNNIEVIVKFDEDQDLSEALKIIENYKNNGLLIKSLISPRGRGYGDSSFFYAQLIFLADPNSKIFSAHSIDLKFINKGFDGLIINSSEQQHSDEIFVIHPTEKFSLKNEITDINKAVQFVECFPFWSRKWIEIQGCFGYNSSSDGYTGLVEYFLFHEYGIDRRIDLSQDKIIEETHTGVAVTSNYWQGPRKTAMEIHLSNQSINFARQAAKNLAMNISNSWKKDDYTNYLIQNCLNNYDKNLLMEREIYNLREEKRHLVLEKSNCKNFEFPKEKSFKKNKIVRRLQRLIFPPLLIYDKINHLTRKTKNLKRPLKFF